MAQAITYRTTEKRNDLRTVVVENVRSTVVLLPQGSLDVVQAKLLHGTSCAHSFWAAELGTDSDTFIVPAAQIVQTREIQIAAKVRVHK
jgi:hypothetical protein